MLYGELFDRLHRPRGGMRPHIPFHQIDRSKLTDQWIFDVRQTCLTELSALYATEMFIRDFYADIDFSAFLSIWFYEEMKHFLTMKKNIKKCGLHLPDLDTELPKLRMSFDPGPAVQTMTLHFIGG